MKSDEQIVVCGDDNPAIRAIVTTMGELLGEVRMSGMDFRVPREMRPEGRTDVNMREADELVTEALGAVFAQLALLIEQLSKIDSFYEARIKEFLEKWEHDHPNEDKRFFWYLKFRMEAHATWIALHE